MLQLPRDSLWYLKDKLTLWDWAIVGVTALVWSSTKQQLMSADFSSTIKATTTFDSSPRSHLCTAYFCSCTHALEPLLFCSILHLRLLLGSLHQSALQAASEAQLSTATYKSTWQTETRVSGSCIQKWGLPLYSSSVTQDSYSSAWAKPTMPYQKVLQEEHHQGVTLGQVCHFMPCCCTEKSTTTC